MDTGRVGTPPDYLVNANERQYLAKLCWLLHDAGTHVLRLTFDSFHPPLSLRPHLGQNHVKSVLQKLREQKLLSEKQWRMLYPVKKQEMLQLSSQTFDAPILAVLLQFICHLSPPYPHGWGSIPLPQDCSLSADIVRLQLYFQQVGSLGGVRHEEYPVLWKQIVEVLLRLGGPEVRVKIARIDQETLTPEEQTHYISLVKSSWGTPEEAALWRLRNVGNWRLITRRSGAEPNAAKLKTALEKSGSDSEGVSAEERVMLNRTRRQLCDTVMAEDLVERLVQGHVINFADKQEILTPGRNQDRMQILLSKVVSSKLPVAFSRLLEALRFKYPRVYESINNVKKTTEVMSSAKNIMSVCQEGLTTHYRSLFSKIAPLPWSDTQTSIRDVYVPLDVCSEDGKKLQLSQMLPPPVTLGRGKRVLIEGESGSGKTYLMTMLTYQWANHRAYFNNQYELLIYLDARLAQTSLAKAVHALVLPDRVKVSAEEFWKLLEERARDTVFIIEGFEEDHCHPDLKALIQGDILRHACVMLSLRPEGRLGRGMTMDDKLYVLGLSNLNVVRCLKTYAVIAQMTSEEFDAFHDVIKSQDFKCSVHLGNPYICLVTFGIYISLGSVGLTAVTTLASLLQQFLVAMATTFSRRFDLEVNGTSFHPEFTLSIGHLQELAYNTLLVKTDFLSNRQHSATFTHLKASIETKAVSFSTERRKTSVTGEGGPEPEGSGNGESEARVVTKEKGPVIGDLSSLTKLGLLHRVERGFCSFTCSLIRDFLAARHLADLTLEALIKEINQQDMLRHARFAQMMSFLCGLRIIDAQPASLASLFKELSIQVMKHSRKVIFKNHIFCTAVPMETDEENGLGGRLTNFWHCLQALSQTSTQCPDLVAPLVQSLPKSIVVQRDGLIPRQCIYGLAAALRNPSCQLSSFEMDLQPHHVHQTNELLYLAQALAEQQNLQNIVLRWQNLSLMISFLKTCLATAPPMHNVTVVEKAGSRHTASTAVGAVTWVALQELGALLRNTRNFTFANCGAVHVVSQCLLCLPSTLHSLDLSGCAFNAISAGDLGAKLESWSQCTSLNLSNASLKSSDLSVLLHNLKLNNSLQQLRLAACHIDRVVASALAEYIRLNSSLRRLDLSRCRLSSQVCRLLSSALLQNRALTTVDVTGAEVDKEGQEVLITTKPGEVTLLGLQEANIRFGPEPLGGLLS